MSASQQVAVQQSAEWDDTAGSPFTLYVEGPRDREILCAWAWRVSPLLSRMIERCAVILGGRRPERARAHFERIRAAAGARARALCVLDRDVEPAPCDEHRVSSPALEFFTWGRRHIESYLLVPDAILRCAGLPPEDPRLRRILSGLLPHPTDETALRALNAKPLLGTAGAVSRALGRVVSPGGLAREMDRAELHADVLALLGSVERLLGEPAAPSQTAEEEPDPGRL